MEKNCNVVIADLGLRPEAQKLVDEYTTQPRAVFVKTDVVMWDQLMNMFDVAEKEFGGADIVSLHILSCYLYIRGAAIVLTVIPGMSWRGNIRARMDKLLAPTWNCSV